MGVGPKRALQESPSLGGAVFPIARDLWHLRGGAGFGLKRAALRRFWGSLGV